MKKSSLAKKAVLIAGMCLSSGIWLAAQYAPAPTSPPRKEQTLKPTEQQPAQYGEQPAATERTATDQPTRVNKASGLFGMEIKNHKGEHLGRIRDIVFDLKNERVAYAVMSVSDGAFGLREKLHAVPLSAFEPGTDEAFIMLRADKEKLARAEGFDKGKWPSVINPAWGAEPFWEGESGKSKPEIGIEPEDPAKAKGQRKLEPPLKRLDLLLPDDK